MTQPFKAKGYIIRRLYSCGYGDKKDTITLTIRMIELESTPEEENRKLSHLIDKGPVEVMITSTSVINPPSIIGDCYIRE